MGTQTEDILNSILPPKEWTEDDQLWVQYVSSHPLVSARFERSCMPSASMS